MSTNNKKSTLTQALLEMEEITSAIKEESKKSLNALLSEAVRDAIRESCNEDEEDDYEVMDDEKNDATDMENDSDSTESVEDETDDVEAGEDVEDEEPSEDFEATQEEPEDGEGEEDWNEFNKYQVSDNTYDLTGENDYENVVKVYKLLKDDDQVVIKKDGDKISLKDDSVGTEYVIDLGTDEGDDSVEVELGEEEVDSINEGFGYEDDDDEDENSRLVNDFLKDKKNRLPDDFEEWSPSKDDSINEDYEYEDDDEISRLIDDFLKDPRNRIPDDVEELKPSDIAGFEGAPEDGLGLNTEEPEIDPEEELDDEEPLFESRKNKFNKKARKPMKESKEVLFEVDLGYTDNYQAKDPIAGLSNDEPSKKGKSWHKGVPTGTQKPWAGQSKTKGQPFEKTVNEEEMLDMETPVEEGVRSTSTQGMRKPTKTPTSEPRRDNAPEGAKKISTAKNGYEAALNEVKKLRAENKALKGTLLSLKKNLSEAYVTNVNLGKITKLFLENTTTQAEKADIVNRFSNEAKTVEQSNTLYESIKRELNRNTNTQMNINESMSKANAETINENTYKSAELLKTIDLMNRMGC